jgi:hypothetical protein
MFLKNIFKENGYNDRQIHRALNRRPLLPQPDNEPHSVAFLPFVGTVFKRISRVLARHSIKSVGLPYMKLSSLFRPVKDHLGLRTPGVYMIPCECGRVYIGQTGRSLDIRLKEHQRHIRLEHSVKSAIPEHSIDQGHCIQVHNSYILAMKPDIWTTLSGRPLRLNSISTISTERVASVSEHLGSLLSAP